MLKHCHACSACFIWIGWVGGLRASPEWLGRHGPANVAEMPEARLDWTLEDAQYISIMLSYPNFFGPFPAGPRAFGESVAHAAGRTVRREWRDHRLRLRSNSSSLVRGRGDAGVG